MFLLVAANCCPCRGSASTRPIDVGTLAPNHNARSKCRRLDQQEWQRERRGGGGGRAEGERGRGDSATKEEKKDKPEEFSTVSWLVRNEAGQERNGKGDLLVVPVSAGSGLTE